MAGEVKSDEVGKINDLIEKAKTVRVRILQMIHSAPDDHPGQSIPKTRTGPKGTGSSSPKAMRLRWSMRHWQRRVFFRGRSSLRCVHREASFRGIRT